MAMPAAEIEALIKAALPDAKVEIEALVDDGDHYLARITSSAFAGLSRIQQHKLVYKALGGLDEVAITLGSNEAIIGYEARLRRDKPWLARGTGVAA